MNQPSREAMAGKLQMNADKVDPQIAQISQISFWALVMLVTNRKPLRQDQRL
jgi:hypothetical protein